MVCFAVGAGILCVRHVALGRREREETGKGWYLCLEQGITEHVKCGDYKKPGCSTIKNEIAPMKRERDYLTHQEYGVRSLLS